MFSVIGIIHFIVKLDRPLIARHSVARNLIFPTTVCIVE